MTPRRSGNGFITSEQWPSHFAGCIFVEALNMAFCSDGRFLPEKVFRVRFGGYKFAMDASGSEHTTNAWEAWTEHRVYAPAVATSIFHDPELPHGRVVKRLLNINPRGLGARSESTNN